LALLAGAIGSTPWIPAVARRLAAPRERAGIAILNTAMLAGLLVLSVMHVAARTYNPFIYFRF